MHRPAPGDVDVHFGRALQQAPELVGPVQRLKRALAVEDEDAARAALAELEQVENGAGRGGRARPAGDRRRARPRCLLAAAHVEARRRDRRRPATNLVLAVVLFAALFLVGGGKATSTVDQVLAEQAGRGDGAPAGRRRSPR